MTVLRLPAALTPQPGDAAIDAASGDAASESFSDAVTGAMAQVVAVKLPSARFAATPRVSSVPRLPVTFVTPARVVTASGRVVRSTAADFDSFLAFARRYGGSNAPAARQKDA
jgi:hypothetical protein